MRATDVLGDSAIPHRTLLGDAAKPGIGAVQAPVGLQSLRDYLPPWLGGIDARTQPLFWMLKALDTATESYLGTSVSSAEVVLPFPVSISFLKALRAVCFSLSLKLPLSALPPAGIFAARVDGIGGKCEVTGSNEATELDVKDDPEQLILTVDYSRAALTALLVVEECGIFEYRGVLHDTSLGADALSRRSDSSRSDITHALRNITSLPLEDGNGAGLKQISELILLGESAGDQRLEDVLKEILGEQSGRLFSSVSDRRTKPIDPLFAASNGVAQDCLDRINFRDDDEHNDSL